MDGAEQIWKDFMERLEFTAEMYSPGIDKGRDQFVKIIGKVIREFKIIHILLDVHFSEECFQGGKSQIADRGYLRYFAHLVCGPFKTGRISL